MSRILFYCQFRHSLGHFARTRLIAEKVTEAGGQAYLLFGGRRPPGLALDPRIEVLEMPDMGDSLTDTALVAQRAHLIKEHIDKIRPQRVLVDYLPLGLGAELVEALLHSHPATEFCWGMPYPGSIKTAPRNPRVRQALARYQRAFVYTSEGWLDPVDSYRQYGLPPRVHHVGVVVPSPLPPLPSPLPVVVGLAGAGIGAAAVIRLLLSTAGPLAQAGQVRLRLIAGVYHDAVEAVQQAKGTPGVEVIERGGAEEMTQDAAVVVGRCGYNTAFSLANTDLPLIFIPWPSPDPAYTEQFDRAKALATLPGIWWLDERDQNAENSLESALSQALARGRAPRPLPFTTAGAEETAQHLLSRCP